ncbi:MAG: GH1 family beta-glucosidase [Acidimicrobiia bacterium]|nr:GH1 family beta-glucosidase [Acidimicrobiia bacterium]
MEEAASGRQYLTAFGPDFVWGAATAAYQIEGATTEDGRGPSIWDTFSRLPGKTRNGDTGDVACDHYHRWREDLTIAADLGLAAYRFSVSWVRLQPTGRGSLNRSAVGFYRSLLEYLHELGIRPFVTLYHWDLPQELEDVGGWPERDTALRFAEYAQRTAEALGDLAEDWITLNESWCQAFNGYHLGVHAPGRRELPAAVAAAHHLNLAGGLATQAIRSVHAKASVGIAHILTDVRPASQDPEDEAAARRVDANHNRLFLDPLLGGGYGEEVVELHGPHGLLERIKPGDDEVMAEAIDFLRVNHYQQVMASDDLDEPFLRSRIRAAAPAATSLGWSVRPESLRNVLVRVDREYGHIPSYVTENGACFEDYVGPDGEVRDRERIDYLDRYVTAVAQAASEGVDVRGYFAWSLLDNFEWAEGYRKRFGLVYVDYRTQERIPKASARWYRDLILQHRNLLGVPARHDVARVRNPAINPAPPVSMRQAPRQKEI